MKALLLRATTMETEIIDLNENLTSQLIQTKSLLRTDDLDYTDRRIEGVEYSIALDDWGLTKEDYIISAVSKSTKGIIAGDLLISKTDHLDRIIGLEKRDIKRIIRNIDEVVFESGETKKVLLFD